MGSLMFFSPNRWRCLKFKNGVHPFVFYWIIIAKISIRDRDREREQREQRRQFPDFKSSKLTCERGCKIEKLCPEVGYLREGGLYVFLEVLHGHGGQVEQLVRHLEGATQRRSLPDVVQDTLDLIENLEIKNKNVFTIKTHFFMINIFRMVICCDNVSQVILKLHFK